MKKILFLWLAASSGWAQEPGRARGLHLEVQIDATDASRRLFHCRITLPCEAGPVTLLYPKWIPGEHGPTGPLADVAGFRIAQNGRAIPWRRDELDLHAIHCEAPSKGVLEVSLDYVPPPPGTEGFISAQSSAKLTVFHWNQLLVYPRGRSMGEITLASAVELPEGWKCSTALPVASVKGRRIDFQDSTLETLVDSPVLIGAHLREIPLGPQHWLCLAADSESALAIPDGLKASFERLVVEAGALFGTRHYRSYRFFLALSDLTPPFFLEHHECSDNRAPERTLLDENLQKRWLFILAHEYAHSWNGKHRRPADMVKPDFQEPIATRLLWVYEGLTEYLGCLLAARCGIWTADEWRDNLALAADGLANQKGRTWRPLEDTTRAAPILYAARNDWASWRRGVDFYNEGLLLWLEVDTIVRQESRGAKSLDDFCRRFHGGEGGMPGVRPYTFDDLVDALQATVAYDWRKHLTERITSLSPEAPTDGIARGGWKVTLADAPSELYTVRQGTDKSADFTTSIGLLLKDDGSVTDLIPGKAADRAKLGPGMKVIAVNGRKWSSDLLREAVAGTKGGGKLELLVENGQFIRPHALDYTEGEKYPKLERVDGSPDLLQQILKPLGENPRPPAK